MLTATSSFMDAMEKWLKAAREDDFDTAKFHAKNMVLSGELMTIHPDFIRCFQHHCKGFEPKEALLHLCQFLVCATDGRARVLKQYVKDNRPDID